jgi:hypothetical protein
VSGGLSRSRSRSLHPFDEPRCPLADLSPPHPSSSPWFHLSSLARPFAGPCSFYVLQNTVDLKDAAVVTREVEYAIGYIRKAPSNASAWNFLRGLIEAVGFGTPFAFPQVRALCEELGTGPEAESGQRCVHAVSLLVSILQSSIDAAEKVQAAKLCEELSSLDPIRERYWRWAAVNGGGGGGMASATPATVEVQ